MRPTAASIETWLVERLANLVGLQPDEIDPRAPFASFGLSSVDAVSLSGDLADWLGVSISPTLVWDHPTVQAIAHHLAAPAVAPANSATAATATEPVAVVGMACRFPGAPDVNAFWKLLVTGTDAIRTVPADRWDADAYYDQDPAAPGKMTTRWGGFINEIDRFDAAFFGISPREASRMDPQQRLLLEVAWEALEAASLPPRQLAGSATGVFVGISSGDYGHLQIGDPVLEDAYVGTGNAMSIAANRLSYFFDFRGPSLAVDTACSSSLVAVHLACRALQAGEATLALAGGVNLLLNPLLTVNFSKAGFMAPDGRCKAFDARANGYVRGEGAGVIVLKPLSRARADGDQILALIRGSAVNQDGRSNGLTAPNRMAQERVLDEAYRRAGVSPGDISYIETHGTGTALGDPIEARALGTILARGRPAQRPCAIGSVKSNIGHLEAAAGMAGLIKSILAMQHRQIPASLHYDQPNPHIPFQDLPLRVQAALGPWPQGLRLLAGVSAFGFGGTNSHLVLEGAPPADMKPGAVSMTSSVVPVSAQSADALKARVHQLGQWLQAHPGTDVAALGATAALGREHMEFRHAVVGRTAAELADALADTAMTTRRPAKHAGVVMVFSGQGPQAPGMARELYQESSVFRDQVEEIELEALRLGPGSVKRWFTNSSDLDPTDTATAQLGIFTVQAGLLAVWRSRGVDPVAVVGHSAGEVAAAFAAGVLTLAEAVQVVHLRGMTMSRSGAGRMMAVGLSGDETLRLDSVRQGRVSVAVWNAPRATVVAGPEENINQLAKELMAGGTPADLIPGRYAFHSPVMAGASRELAMALAALSPRPARASICSTVTGGLVEGRTLTGAYWGRQVREPVRFQQAIETLLAHGHRVFLEISPHPVLGAYLSELVARSHGHGGIFHSLRHGRSDAQTLAAALAGLYTWGVEPHWPALYPGGRSHIPLPPYPWQRRHHWIPATARHAPRALRDHPLLGSHINPSHRPAEHLWSAAVSQSEVPYLVDHQLHDTPVVPGAAFADMALAAGRRLFGSAPFYIEGLDLHQLLAVPPGSTRELQLCVTARARGEAAEAIWSSRSAGAPAGEWTVHARAFLVPQDAPADATIDVAVIQKRAETVKASGELRDALEAVGLRYGPIFQRLGQIHRRGGLALAALSPLPAGGHEVHPALLDAAFQLAAAVVPQTEQRAFVPVHMGKIRRGRSGAVPAWALLELQPGHASTLRARAQLLSADGVPVLTVEDLELRAVALGTPAQRVAPDSYHIEWVSANRPATTVAPRLWWIVSNDTNAAAALSVSLHERGHRTTMDAPDTPGASPVQAVLFLPRPSPPTGSCAAAAIENTQQLVQIIGRLLGMPSPPPLWIVTRGAQSLGGTIDPAHSALWGVAATANAEAGTRLCRLIDLAADGLGSLIDELLVESPEDRVALRASNRWVPRLVRAPALPPDHGWKIRSEAAYLLTGGTGGLGLATATALVEAGARHLVMTSRNTPGLAATTQLDRLRARGARITLVQADAGQLRDMEQVMRLFGQEFPPLAGVLHIAGILEDAAITRMASASIARVMAGKVNGAEILDHCTRDLPLDFFVLYGSIAGVLGSPGQANYAAANAFLDGLAHRRRAAGQSAVSIAWGPWEDVGMAAAALARGQRVGVPGLEPIPVAAGLGWLARLATGPLPQITCLAARWETLGQALTVVPPFLSSLIEAKARTTARSVLGRELRSLPPEAARRQLTAVLCRRVEAILRLNPGEVEENQPLTEVGLDSLMTMELQQWLEAELGTRVPAVQLLKNPTLGELAEGLIAELGGTGQTAARGPSLENELSLPEQLVADPALLVFTDKPRDVFLTGASGYLGAYLLAELLASTQSRVHCLVRADSLEEGMTRLRENLLRHELWKPDTAERIRPILGDLAQPRLGLTQATFDDLAERMDALYHAGAWVNFAYDYSVLRAANVSGTLDVLQMAVKSRLKPVHYVSTLGMLLSTRYGPGTRIDEAREELASEGLANGYEQSKWVADRLVARARARGVPASIYRVGLLTGNGQTGLYRKTDDFFPSWIKGCIQLGAMPQLSTLAEMVPVDYASRLLVATSLRRDLLGRTYHINHPDPVSLDGLAELITRSGYRLERLPFVAWKDKLLADLERSRDNALYPHSYFVQMLEESQSVFPQIGAENARAAAAALGVHCPGVSVIMERYIRYFQKSGYFPTPPR